MIRLAIVDDDALIRESLKILLHNKENIQVTHLGENGLDALRISKEGVDVMLLDLRMPTMGGLEALRQMEHTKVLILTTFDEEEEIKQALNLGAKGYLLKSATPGSIQHAISQVAQGKNVLDEVAMKVLRKELVLEPHVEIDLSEREMDILRLISEGLSNKQIAETLFIGEGTVKNYVSSILTKTGLDHRTQLAVWYLKGKL